MGCFAQLNYHSATEWVGFEPTISPLSVVVGVGLEPTISCVSDKRFYQLIYPTTILSTILATHIPVAIPHMNFLWVYPKSEILFNTKIAFLILARSQGFEP